MARVGFIGLGVMGFSMAGHLATNGHDVTVYNRTKSKVDNWLNAYNGQVAESPGELARNSEFVFCCVGNLFNCCFDLLVLQADGVPYFERPGPMGYYFFQYFTLTGDIFVHDSREVSLPDDDDGKPIAIASNNNSVSNTIVLIN